MAAACVALFAAPHAARAGRPQPTSETKSLHEWAALAGQPVLDPPVSGSSVGIEPIPGGPNVISGSTPPIFNPLPPIFFPWKTGTVDLRAVLRNGSTRGAIDVSVTGYAPGAYTVSAVTESASLPVVLGTLTVTSGSIPIWSGSNPILPIVYNGVASSPAVIVLPPWGFTTGYAHFGGKHHPFPGGFSPFDVDTLSLSDSNGNVVSTATLTPVPDGYYHAISPLAAGTSSPGATGFALIRASTPPVFEPLAQAISRVKASVWGGPVPVVPPIIIFHPTTGELVIHAHGLPASDTLTYAADGTDLGTVTTGTSGNLYVHATQGDGGTLPSTLDLFSVETVTVHDASGDVFVSAGF